MVRTRSKAKREALPAPSPGPPPHPSLQSLPPAAPSSQPRKPARSKTHDEPASTSEAPPPTSSLSSVSVPPPSAPPRASIEALEKLFRPPPYAALRAAASKRQKQVSRTIAAAMGPPRATKCTAPQLKTWYKIFEALLSQNASSFTTLIETANPFADMSIWNTVKSTIEAHPHLPPPAPANGYISWLLSLISQFPSLPECLQCAVKERDHRKVQFRNSKRNTAANYRVFKTARAYAQFHFTILHLWLSALPPGEEYPPRAHWLVETQELYDLCLPFLENQKLADERRGRFPIHKVVQERMQIIIPEGITCLIYDCDTNKLVCSVVRNFSGSQALLEWVSLVVGEGVDTRKSVRLEDSGSIVLIGFSAGARSRPLFGLARNLLRKSTDTTAADVSNAAVSAYFWKHVQVLHPREVSDSIEAFYREHSFPMLDPKWPYSREILGDIDIPSFDGHLLTFQDVEHEPGCMVYVQRYARPSHREMQPHEWSSLWTVLREGLKPAGNHFYISSYGICIRQEVDTSIAWKPSHYHTSSLGNWDPHKSWARGDDPVMNQRGIGFVTSPRVAAIWRRWADENIPPEKRFEGAIAELEALWESEYSTD